MSRFAVHVHQLTQPHLAAGQPQAPLLARLRAATTPGSDGGKAGADGGKPVPVNLTAVDLLCKIQAAARTEWQILRGFPYVGHLEDLLADLVRPPFVELPEDWDDYLHGKATGWIEEILALLHPVKPRRRLHRPCPACGAKYHGDDRLPALTVNCWDEDEAMMHPSRWDASCEACGVVWHGDDVQWLARALSAV